MFLPPLLFLVAVWPGPTLAETSLEGCSLVTELIPPSPDHWGDSARKLPHEQLLRQEPGSLAPELQVVEKLGEGGFGEVLMVNVSMYSTRNLVLKKLSKPAQSDTTCPPSYQTWNAVLFGVEAETFHRISDELPMLPDQNLRRIGETHIVKLVGSYTTPEHYGLLLSPAAPCNLYELLEAYNTTTTYDDFVLIRNKYRVKKALVTTWLQSYFADLAGVVHCLHSMGIEHNDITPKNILCGSIKSDGTLHAGGTLRLCDLGLAHVVNDYAEPHGVRRIPSDYFCNPIWTSPERLLGLKNTAYKDDLYNVGLVFLELHTVLNGETLAALDEFLELYRVPNSKAHTSIPIRGKLCEQEAVAAWLATLGEPNEIAFLVQHLVCGTAPHHCHI